MYGWFKNKKHFIQGRKAAWETSTSFSVVGMGGHQFVSTPHADHHEYLQDSGQGASGGTGPLLLPSFPILTPSCMHGAAPLGSINTLQTVILGLCTLGVWLTVGRTRQTLRILAGDFGTTSISMFNAGWVLMFPGPCGCWTP